MRPSNQPLSRPLVGLALSLSACSLVAPTASALIVPLSQNRSISSAGSATALAPGATDNDTDSAPGFGTFDEDVSSLALDVDTGGPITAPVVRVAIGSGSADQNSTLGLLSIQASGSAGVSLTLAPAPASPVTSASGSGNSFFDVFFNISEPSNFFLSGSVDTQSVLTGGAALPTLDNEVLFFDVSNNVTIFQVPTNDEAFSISGTLAQGTYRLRASATSSATQAANLALYRTVSGLSSFDLRLRTSPVVPETSTVLSALTLGALLAGTWVRSRRSS